MNIRWTVFLSAITLVLLAWYYSLNQDDQQLATLIKKEESPEYIGHKMSTVVYSPTGKKQYLAVSDKVEYYNYDGHTNFERPLVYLFEIAILTKDNMLYLKGNVIAETLLPQSKLQRIETEDAKVNLNTQDISSDNTVKINGQNFTSTGLKLTGNLQQQIANLKEQVKTYYEINK